MDPFLGPILGPVFAPLPNILIARDASERLLVVEVGKPTDEYARWIVGTDQWGGVIELPILCEHYKMVISCVCIQMLRVDHYGENCTPHRHTLFPA